MKQSNLPSLFKKEGLILPVSSTFSKVMKDFFGDDPFFNFGIEIANSGYPKIDVIDETDKVIVKAELAGLKKEDIDIEYKNDVLAISGEKKEERKVEKQNYVFQELRNGKFCRQIRIDENIIQSDKISAKFENGILEVEIPKKEEKILKEETKKVEIK